MRQFNTGIPEPIRDKEADIPQDLLYPHYSDRRFYEAAGGITIFLANGLSTVRACGVDAVDGAHYLHADQLDQIADRSIVEAARRTAEELAGSTYKARYFELMLQGALQDESLDLQHMISGVQGNGYSWLAYGYTTADTEAIT